LSGGTIGFVHISLHFL